MQIFLKHDKLSKISDGALDADFEIQQLVNLWRRYSIPRLIFGAVFRNAVES